MKTHLNPIRSAPLVPYRQGSKESSSVQSFAELKQSNQKSATKSSFLKSESVSTERQNSASVIKHRDVRGNEEQSETPLRAKTPDKGYNISKENEPVKVEDSKEPTDKTALFYFQQDPTKVNEQQNEISPLEMPVNGQLNLQSIQPNQPIVNDLSSQTVQPIIELVNPPLVHNEGALEVLAETSEQVGNSQNVNFESEVKSANDLAKRFDQMISAYDAEITSVVVRPKAADVQSPVTLQVDLATVELTENNSTMVEKLSTFQSTEGSQTEGETHSDDLSVLTAQKNVKPSENSKSNNSVDQADTSNTESSEFVVSDLRNANSQNSDAKSGLDQQSDKDGTNRKEDVKVSTRVETNSHEKINPFADRLNSIETGGIDSKKDVLFQQRISPTAILEQIKEAMMKAPLKQGERSEMVLQLKPEELGKVELKIEVHKDTVIAKFEVASMMVKETIESSLADLRSSLKDKGFGDMTFDVNVSKEKTNDADGRNNHRHSKRGRNNSGDTVSNDSISSRYERKSLSQLVGVTQFEHYA